MRSLGTLLLLAAALPLFGQSHEGYAGQEVCIKCHSSIGTEYSPSRHSRMIQPATPRSVEGDCSAGKVALGGSTFLLAQRGNDCYITESELSGKPWEHRVEYTLGGRRIQQYLSTMPDGSIVLIPAAWDNIRKRWLHDVDIGNPETPPGDAGQIWNRSCYSCHVSQGQKNFDLEHLRYRTTWQDLGVGCERCHGPGALHAARAAAPGGPAVRTETTAPIVNPAKLDPLRSSMICAQCHSFRDVYADGFPAGANYYDYFLPVMEYRLPASDDPAYWPDGRPRWFANEVVGLWQSQCFLKGRAACSSCHLRGHNTDVERSSQLRSDDQTLCAGCHKAIASNVAAHTHHAPKSSGSSCLECHMPAVVTSLQARMRDHSISIPAPENTAAHAIPNACNLCHQDRDAAWAVEQMNAWYGARSRRQAVQRADAFTRARASDPAAIPALLQILSDVAGGPWIRANAAGYLGNFPNDPSAYEAVRHAFSDPEPLVRATAAAALKPLAAQREIAAPEFVSLLRDPVRTVRMTAGIALVAMGVKPFPGEDGVRFEEAKQLYRARAALSPDDAGQQFAAGKFLFLAGDMNAAEAAFRATIKLDPAIPVRYPLARSLEAKGDYAGARQVLRDIARDDPQYGAAQQLLAAVELKFAGQATEGASAHAQFLEGQVQYQAQYYAVALKDFDQALRLAPQAEWAVRATIYRAICLEKLGRLQEAENAMQVLIANPIAGRDAELQFAFVELLLDTGRAEEAQRRIDDLIAGVANDPVAWFWRAKVLLQLHRTQDAAAAAEESVRLQPQLPQAHNLLIRIYQMQGRGKEAAQQAEWLRDYQRRMDLH